MKVVKIVVLVLVALACLVPGFMKLMTPYADMIVEPAMAWANDYSANQVKGIGVSRNLGSPRNGATTLAKKVSQVGAHFSFGVSSLNGWSHHYTHRKR